MARPDLPAGTVTFLFSDIESSTRLLHELGDGYVEALAEHRRVVRAACARHGGVEVDTQGDAFFVAFPDAVGAATAAAEAQAALANGPVSVRMGLHTGEPIVWDEGYAGVDVHRGARIAAAAHGGQVVLSERTAALLDGADVRPLGAHRLKDLSEPQPLFQLGGGEFPPLKALYATNLPAQPSPLIGRERELAETTALLADGGRLVTLIGPGGSGKTRLALQAVADVSEEFPDGVCWVPLAGVGEADLVIPTVEATLGAKEGVFAHIASKRMLLLLDNFEQVLRAAPRVADLLRECPNLTVLVTSRAALRISGEHEYHVEPLPDADAISLFTERARAVVPGFAPDGAVAEVCRRVDRLPLAIELAAARVRLLSPRDLLARLDQRLPLLTGGRRDAPDRQRTLRATIEWSYDLLAAEEQRLFARLAVFAGSFTLDAAESVCEASLDRVEALLEQSLLRRWASGRLGMLETIRELALERLAASGERDAIVRRHFDHFLALAEGEEYDNESGSPAWLDAVDRERDNLRAALRWGLDEGDPVRALQLACALGRFWVVRAHREGYTWLSEALDRASDAPTPLRATGLMWAGSTVYFTGDFERAAGLAEQALDLFRRLGDKRNVARVLDRLAAPYAMRGDDEKGRALADESLALFRELGDRKGALYPLTKVAADEYRRGDRALGVRLTEEALELAREAGDVWWTAGLLGDLAEMAWEQGDGARAAALARESVSLGHQIRNAWTLFYGLGLLAVLAAEAGESRRAGRLWGGLEALEESGEVAPDPETRSAHEKVVFAAADAELEAGRAEGRAMTLDEAVEVALADA